jgi:hypothetical protein
MAHVPSSVELAQLFQDMAILVESQGELLNSIDNNGELAARHHQIAQTAFVCRFCVDAQC